jgi:hypothetical protein
MCRRPADGVGVRLSPALRTAFSAAAGAVVLLAALPGGASALTLSVSTKSPQDVQATTATMRADVSVSALGAQVTWQYGPTSAYGSITAPVTSSLVGVNQTLTAPVTGLTAKTTYHVRAVATSGLTTTYGKDITFNTNGSGGSGGESRGNGRDDDDDDSGSGPSSGPGPATPAPSAPAAPAPTPAHGPAPQPSGPGGPGANGPTKPADVASDPRSVDPAAAVTPGTATAAVTPVLGKTLAIAQVQGTVAATAPSGAPVDLTAAAAVPTGTLIDARAGTVELTTAVAAGRVQTARFWGARFEVHQAAGARGLTRIVLRGGDFSSCAATTATARRSVKKKRKPAPQRTLWGSDDHGRFETRGRGSVATVRGTRWMTRDTCAGTLTRVASGAVDVKDIHKHRTVTVRRGREYLARAG